MKWSQLKRQIRALICPELCERIDMHVAIYRKAGHIAVRRASITVDGCEVFDFNDTRYWKTWYEAGKEFRASQPAAGICESYAAATTILDERQVFRGDFLSQSLHRYCEMSISQSLVSSNPVIRAFATIDRRLGKRTLAKLKLSEQDHPLIRHFYALRIGAAQ
jgi:hypothetical protein